MGLVADRGLARIVVDRPVMLAIACRMGVAGIVSIRGMGNPGMLFARLLQCGKRRPFTDWCSDGLAVMRGYLDRNTGRGNGRRRRLDKMHEPSLAAVQRIGRIDGEDGKRGENNQREPHVPGDFTHLVMAVMVVVAVTLVMVFRGGLEMGAAFAEKYQPYLPTHVERREHGGKESERRYQIIDPAALDFGETERAGENGVLAHKAAGERQARKRQRGEREGREGPRHLFPQAAHPAHVLFVVHGVDDRAGTEEEAGLEERVRQKMEKRGGICSDTETEHHVAELGNRRIGEHALDVMLGDGDGGRHESRECADERDNVQCVGRQDGEYSADEVDSRRDHGGRMDKRGNRRGAFHGVRKPYMQRELG